MPRGIRAVPKFPVPPRCSAQTVVRRCAELLDFSTATAHCEPQEGRGYRRCRPHVCTRPLRFRREFLPSEAMWVNRDTHAGTSASGCFRKVTMSNHSLILFQRLDVTARFSDRYSVSLIQEGDDQRNRAQGETITRDARIMSGITLITGPTIQYGRVLSADLVGDGGILPAVPA
jgi:hypothetical protein